ncbi:hypothetical protein Tco_0493003 [Tanacetum coccineum]
MEITIADQIALDDALVAPANRLKIGKCNLRLSSDVTSKEATLQVVYDVLKLTPFYKAFQVTADVPEIYMQEFWVGNKKFEAHFSASLVTLVEIRKITDVKIENKKYEEGQSMYYPPRKIPSQPKASKKKANSDATTKQKPPTVPKEKKGKKTGKGKQKAKELETISEAILTPEMKNWCFTRGTVALIMNSDDDDLLEVNDNEVEGVDVEGEKSDEDATYVEDQGNKADRDTNANLEGRDDVMADVVLVPRFKQPMKLKTLMYPISVNPDGHNKSSLYHLLRSQHLNPRSRYRVERYLDIMLKLPL